MDISLIAVPYHLGRPGAGAASGPDRILRAVSERGLELPRSRVALSLPFANEVAATMNVNTELAGIVAHDLAAHRTPVTIAADCISCIGTLAGMNATLSTAPAARTLRTGVVWLDAHGDFNTANSSPTGYLDGMALASATGLDWGTMTASVPGFRPVHSPNVLHLGGRDFDPGEFDRLQDAGVELMSASAVSFVTPDFERALGSLADRVDAVYLHVDLDVLDPSEGTANAYSATGGLTGSELLAVVRACLAKLPVHTVALTAYDPDFDRPGSVAAIAAQSIEALTALA